MELILADKNRVDVMDISAFANAEFDINKYMTFTVQVSRSYYTDDMTFGSWIYIPNTEFGGRIEQVKTDTTLDYVELKGYTPRGKLSKKIIEPTSGQNYRIVSGDVNSIMRTFINGTYDYWIMAEADAGVSVSNFQFERYCTTYNGLVKMLKSVNRKMCCKFVRNTGSPVYVSVYSEPIVDYSSQIELSNDNRLKFTMNDNRMGVNHLIALGKGELKDRTVIHKYLSTTGTVTDSKAFFGYNEVAQIYDFSNAEASELATKAAEKLLELANSKTMDMDVETLNLDVSLGDIIGGKDYLTGISDSKAITNIVYSIEDGNITKKYKIGE